MKRYHLKLGNRYFTPGLASTLITLLLIPLFVYLGLWQIHRYEFKSLREVRLIENQDKEPIDFHSLIHQLKLDQQDQWNSQLDQLLYRKLILKGEFLNRYLIVLDNQRFEKKIGYRILLPFQPENTERLLLVDRGWIPMETDRQSLPKLPAIHGEMTLHGILQKPIQTLQLPTRSVPIQWPARVSTLRLPELSSSLSKPLYPFILQLRAGDPLAFEASEPQTSSTKYKHLGYAIQWFMMAIAVFLYYGSINTHRLEPV